MEIMKVAVIGVGNMGRQIAMQVASSGYEVRCYDRSALIIKDATSFAEKWFEKNLQQGNINNEQKEETQKKIVFSTDLEDTLRDVDLVIESIDENLKNKRQIISEIDKLVDGHTIIATNSSYYVSSMFVDCVRHPENILNLHFFNPVHKMKLVEVVKGEHVSDLTVSTIMDFSKSISKIPVLVKKEIYGFIVNRIMDAITKEACYLLDQEIASAEDIDIAVKYGLAHPMGPFELLDLTGIDIEYCSLNERYKLTGDLADKPSPSIVEKFILKEYGRKTGKGFYTYNIK